MQDGDHPRPPRDTPWVPGRAANQPERGLFASGLQVKLEKRAKPLILRHDLPFPANVKKGFKKGKNSHF
jgi:hypothetical protein